MLAIVFFLYHNNYSILLKQLIKGIVYQEVGLPSDTPLYQKTNHKFKFLFNIPMHYSSVHIFKVNLR